MHGKILFKYGTMSSGKSLQLMATAHNFQHLSIPFLIFKSTIDTRDGENVIHSRALKTEKECVAISPYDNLYSILTEYRERMAFYGEEELKWILIDEAQFLTEAQVDDLAAIADNYGVNIICYGLRTDFQTHLFTGSKRLFEVADSIEEIKSSCKCGSKSIFNARVNTNKELVTSGDQVEIGGDDRYIPMCRKCYFEKSNHSLYNKKKE